MITIEFARTLYPAETDSAHDFDHVLRVAVMADRIAQAEGADREIVQAAALLHDIGLDEGRAGHETSAANRAKEILRAQGYGEPFCAKVAHAIEAHRFRSGPTPQTLEAQVLFDADKLDAIGAIGVARLVFPQANSLLPTEETFDLIIEPRGQVVDAGRFVLGKSHSSLEHRVLAALMAYGWLQVRSRGYSIVCAAFASKAMQRVYQRMGFRLTPLAPPRRVWGEERVPILFDVPHSAAALLGQWQGKVQAL